MIMLFAGRDFVRLWATGGMNSTVRWLDLLVVGVFTYQTTHSSLSTSLVLFLRLLPMFLLGAFVGALAERVNRRLLLVSANVILTATYGVLGTLAYSGRLGVSHVALGALISGIFWAIETPVRRTMLVEAVGIARIGAAMGLETATQNLSRMLGPLVGGLLLEGTGMHGTYWLGGLCCLISLGLLLGVGVGGAPLAAARPNLFADLKAGLRYVGTDRAIQAVLFCTIAVNLFGFSYTALVPVIGQSVLKLTAVQIGLLMSAEGAGALLSALLIAFFGAPRHFSRLFLGGAILFVAGVFGFSLANSYGVALAALFAGGFGIAAFGSMQSTLILSQAPPHMRNRMMGVLTVCIGFSPLGVVIVGLLAQYFDPRAATSMISCLGLLCLAFAAFYWPELRAERAPV